MAEPAGAAPRDPFAVPARPVLIGGAVLAIAAVSTASLFIRLAQESAPSMVVATYRLAFSALILAPFALQRRRAELSGLSRRDLMLALLSGALLALHFASWITSLEHTTVASSVVLVCTSPLFVAVLAPFTIGERLTRGLFVGVLLAVGGGVLVGLGQPGDGPSGLADLGGPALLGNSLALLGALAAAGYFLIGRRLRQKVSLLTYVFLTYGAGAAVLLAILPVTGHPYVGYPPAAYFWCLLLALVPQLVGHTLFNWALRFLRAASIAVLVLGEPIGATLLACLFLAETPGGLELLGAVLILGGIYVVSAQRSR
ncbi:MAG: DMT family transporter [Planctomycetes bacterium]|nr:DMT family transporter [Planctomycetota bacterium]